MADPREIEALKASFRGVLSTAAALDGYRSRVAAIDAAADPPRDALEELLRVVAAHATASAALRGLLVTMLERRVAGRKGEGQSGEAG
jgi:hypothetical protein